MNNLNIAVLLSIRPNWCELIANGKKTIEVRKTKPKIPKPFKCYIYCTQSKEGLPNSAEMYIHSSGKVIGEFICDEIIEDFSWGHNPIFKEKALMTDVDIAWYCLNHPMYLWHISELVIYDEPKELDWFRKPIDCHKKDCTGCWDCEIRKAPQSWCYVEEVA